MPWRAFIRFSGASFIAKEAFCLTALFIIRKVISGSKATENVYILQNCSSQADKRACISKNFSCQLWCFICHSRDILQQACLSWLSSKSSSRVSVILLQIMEMPSSIRRSYSSYCFIKAYVVLLPLSSVPPSIL